jgi:hypothetical protein
VILLDANNKPNNTIYYIAGIAHGLINMNNGIDFNELYYLVNKTENKKVNIEFYSLALDFLFLLDKIDINEEGGLYVIKST